MGIPDGKIDSVIGLIKPELPMIAGVCVIAGQIVSHTGLPSLMTVTYGFLAGFFLSASAMVSNDYFDLEVDRVDKPHRPFPSGRVSGWEVLAIAAVLAALGLVMAALLGSTPLAFAAVILIIGLLYNWRLKESGPLGNMMVAFSVASTFLFGGVSVGGLNDPLIWVFASIAFLFNLAAEISSGAMDMDGDRLRGSRSIAIVHGKEFALRVAGVLTVAIVILTFIPIGAGWLGWAYVVPVIAADLMLLLHYQRLRSSSMPDEGREEIRKMYLVMTVFILAFIIGALL